MLIIQIFKYDLEPQEVLLVMKTSGTWMMSSYKKTNLMYWK